jgi:hypothetical protein
MTGRSEDMCSNLAQGSIFQHFQESRPAVPATVNNQEVPGATQGLAPTQKLSDVRQRSLFLKLY